MKLYLTIISALLTVSLFAQPVNDDCSGIVDLGEAPYCSAPAQFTNVGATASNIDPTFNIPACFNSGGVARDVWFQFTVPTNGSIVDFTVSVFGNDGVNGTLENPQIAVYRGDCEFGGLFELNCISAPNGTNTIGLDLIGLTAGVTYFIRVNDYSPTATPNAGTFKLCVEEYQAEFIMGQTASSASCTGTLFDSGGENGDYSNQEELTFTICPQEFHACIILNVDYETENNADFLTFFQGPDVSGTEVTSVAGFGTDFEVQISGQCATIAFSSDFSVVESGFKITWNCTPTPCTAPPLITCTDPVAIPSLPYSDNNLNNCFSGNSIDFDPCGSTFLGGNDYVFTYQSGGDECISVSASGTNGSAGLGVYTDCPTANGASCISTAGGNFTTVDPLIQAAFLENPGTYYIVFATAGSCTNFNINIDTVTCPILLPPASTCDQALNIAGCNTDLPEIIELNPGAGDPNFIQDGVNQGCFVFPQQNYAFFYFKAGADGKFGFTVAAADMAEASDIDINVWGPITNVEDICNYTANNQPIRSTWTGGDAPTGLQDIHPTTNLPVLDEYDCGSPNTPGPDGDFFVRMLDVQEGEIYVILLDDFGNNIENGGISIDFGGTTAGVLNPLDNPVAAGADTVVCQGQSAQLFASGGAAYSWSPSESLSCTNCANPIASPTESTSYTVQIVTTCGVTPQTVEVEIYEVNLGPDATVCAGAEFQLNENPFEEVSYSWIGLGLSCTDCPTPTVSGLAPGIYTYFCFLTTPFCQLADTLVLTVLPGQQPQYDIAPDQTICAGESIQIGGVGQPGVDLIWTSFPAGFNSTEANPTVAPTTSTTYYLQASNFNNCPVPAIDSVVINVNLVPQINVINDTIICQGQTVQLANTNPQAGVVYSWSADFGSMSQPNDANPLEMPQATTNYTLSATLEQCTVTETVKVQVIPLFLQLNQPDSVRICTGSTINIQANVSPAGTPIVWSPLNGLQVAPNALSATATPNESTLYTATASVPGCVRTASVYIAVDSLPADLGIFPSDTTICQGAQVLLKSKVYEPAEYEYMDFQWTPFPGQLTPDSLFNMVVQPDMTTIYKRVTQNGACFDTAFAVVQVVVPPDMMIVPADTTICPGQLVQLIATVPAGIEKLVWSPTEGLSCDDCTSPIANVQTTTNFTLSGEFMGCPTSTSAQIVVSNGPPIQFPSDLNLCAGESITLNLVADPNATYNWTSTDPAFNQNNAAQPTITPLQTATYTVSASNGCPSNGTITVTVTDASLTISPDTAVCRNEPVQLTANGTVSGTFIWSNGATTQTITVPIANTTTYAVIYTYGDGCTKTANVTTSVSGESVPLDVPATTQLCPGESITLNEASVPAGATYVWSSSPNDPTLGVSAGNPTVSPSSTTTYTVTATLGLCVTTRTVTIGIAEATLSLPADITLCLGESANITATNIGGNITWSTGETGNAISVSPITTTNYIAALTYGNNCIKYDTISVIITPSFEVDIVADPNDPSIGLGGALELTANIVPATGLTQYTFQWLENGVTNIGSTQVINTLISTDEDSIRYVVIATSPNGCVKEASIGFSVVQPKVEIPNAFTPNGDSANDVFQLIQLEGAVEVESMEIYNRWGQKIFTGKGASAVWDGNIDGKPAPVDVYVYRISWRRGDGALQEPQVGEVTLLR